MQHWQTGGGDYSDWQCLSCQRRERLHPCDGSCSSSSSASPTPPLRERGCWHTNENFMHAKQIMIIFYIYFFYYLLYILLFSIVSCQTIVTVCPDKIFLYNDPWQMYQIIHLSLEDCLSSAQGKRVQKKARLIREQVATWFG